MNPCFADTSWFLALLIREDERHHAAHLIADQLRRPIILRGSGEPAIICFPRGTL